MKERALVIGASGFIGENIASKLADKYTTFGTYHNHKHKIDDCEILPLDITNKKETLGLLKRIEPRIVVHSAAIAAPEKIDAHLNESVRINIEGTKNIAKSSKTLGSYLIFISTDYIFDGERGQYREDDAPNPINTYGREKLEGEKIIESTVDDFAIIRTSLVYGWNKNFQRPNFVTSLISSCKDGAPTTAFVDQYRTPTYLHDLVDGICELIERRKTGTYNIAGPEYINRYDFAKKIAEKFNLNKNLILQRKSDEFENHIDKPKKGGLNITRAKKELNIEFSDTKEGLNKMRNNYISGKK